MVYDSQFVIDSKTAAKKFYQKIKKYEHKVEKKKYYDTALDEKYEAWYISVKLKHSVIDAFFFPVGEKTRVIILRKDKPYLTAALGASIILAIFLFGNMILSMTLNPLIMLRNLILASAVVGGTIYGVEKLALPEKFRKIIQSFDAEMIPYREETIDETELKEENEEIVDAEKELES